MQNVVVVGQPQRIGTCQISRRGDPVLEVRCQCGSGWPRLTRRAVACALPQKGRRTLEVRPRVLACRESNICSLKGWLSGCSRQAAVRSRSAESMNLGPVGCRLGRLEQPARCDSSSCNPEISRRPSTIWARASSRSALESYLRRAASIRRSIVSAVHFLALPPPATR